MVFLGIVFPILIAVANTLVMGCSAGEQDVLFTWSFANNVRRRSVPTRNYVHLFVASRYALASVRRSIPIFWSVGV